MTEHEVIPYDHARHAAFLFGSLRTLEAMFPWCHVPGIVVANDLKRTLAAPDARALVAVLPNDHDTLMSACVAVPERNEIAWCYTGYSYRRFGLASSLAIAAGIDFARNVAVRFWTYAAERIRRDHVGYERLYWANT